MISSSTGGTAFVLSAFELCEYVTSTYGRGWFEVVVRKVAEQRRRFGRRKNLWSNRRKGDAGHDRLTAEYSPNLLGSSPRLLPLPEFMRGVG